MSLRFRLFLILGALVAALVGAHGWLVRSLAGDLETELGVVALDVGASVARALSEPPPGCATPPCPERRQVQVFHLADAKVLGKLPAPLAGGAAAGGAAAAGESPPGEPGERVVVRHIVRRGSLPPEASGARFVYRFDTATGEEGPGEPGGASVEKLVLRLADGAPGALQLRGPGLSAEVPIPRLGLEEKLAEFQRRTLIGSLLLLLLGLLAAAYLAHRVSAPLQRLAQAAAGIGAGDWGTAVDERAGASELRQALGAFNRMSARLRELSQQNERLMRERHLGEIGEIARGLAHSLRNPLHALGLSVDEIAARSAAEAPGQPPGEEASLAAAARRQIRRLDRAIRSFLVFASQSDARARPVDLAALAEDVALEALQDRSHEVRLEVRRATPEAGGEEPLELPAVEPELRAMVQALVVNAVEASPPGARVVVRAGAGPAENRFWLEVLDRGGGVAPEIRERLFTPHRTTKAAGSGMGLFLAQRLAAGRYDGGIELLPRDGGGTLARLELGPRAAPEEAR